MSAQSSQSWSSTANSECEENSEQEDRRCSNVSDVSSCSERQFRTQMALMQSDDFSYGISLNSHKNKQRKKRARVEFAEMCESRRESVYSSRRESEDSVKRRGSDLKRFFTRPRSRSRSPTLISLAHSQRLQQPRLSLLGRPICYRHVRQRDPRYRKLQILTHNFLDRPRGAAQIFYHCLQ